MIYVAHFKVFKHLIWKTPLASFQISNNVSQWHICKYFQKHGAHLIKQHIKLLSSIPTMGPLVNFLLKKNTHNKYTIMFFHTLKHIIWNMVHFLLYEYYNHVFFHIFHIILNNNTRNFQPTGLAIQVMILLLFFSQSCTLEFKFSFFLYHFFFFWIFFHQ